MNILTMIPASRRRAAAVAFEVASFSRYDANTAVSTHPIPVPTGTQVGDILIVFFKQGTFQSLITAPSGWTLSDNAQFSAAWKVAASGDLVSTIDFTTAATRQMVATCLRITGADTSDPVSSIAYLNTNDPEPVSTSWDAGNHMAIVAYAQRDASSVLSSYVLPTSPTTFSDVVVQPETTSGSTTPAFIIVGNAILSSANSFDANAFTITASATTQRASLALMVQRGT
jgi:hypothetical protein